MVTLSILVPTTTKRVSVYFANMIGRISAQITALGRNDIEVLGLLDNYVSSIGEKRNTLLRMAKGRYIVFVDDDDRISDDYVREIISAIDLNYGADCIVYDMLCVINGCRKIHSKFGIEYEYTKMAPWTPENCSVKNEIAEQWFGKPSHNMVWSSEIAKSCTFPLINAGEDFAWVTQAWPQIKKQVRIDKILYYYDVVLNKAI